MFSAHLRQSNSHNRALVLKFLCGLLFWSAMVVILHMISQGWRSPNPSWSLGFAALQLYVAAQLLVPILQMEPTERSRVFYLLSATGLAIIIWLMNQLSADGFWQPLIAAVKSAFLLLTATAVGTVLARYIARVRDIVPICIVMSLADLSSWLAGPTADFSRQIENFYRSPVGPPPLVDQVLIKFALPGVNRLAPVFGISDWIMVVFFISVAKNFNLNDNLLGIPVEQLIRQRQIGLYLPVPAVALAVVLVLAQTTGLFIPVLPFIAVIMLAWYGLHTLITR